MLLFIITLIAGCLAVSYGRANADTLVQEPFRIKTAATGGAQWALHRSYHQMQLQYKGSFLEAYYTKPENLVGFGKHITAPDLPAPILKRIGKRFQQCDIVNVMLFIDSKGRIYYYAGVMQSNTLTALKVSSRCRISVLQTITLN